MAKNTIISLIGLAKYIQETIGCDPISYNYHVRDFEISDFILDQMGFPEDTTVELGIEDGFCRDHLTSIIYSDDNPALSYRRLVAELNKLKAEQSDS